MINDELEGLVKIIDEVKKMNKGIYQLLIWILMVYEINKVYNPFNFISQNYMQMAFDQDETNIIQYFGEILNYLKYNLKIKFKFCKCFEFGKFFEDLKNFVVATNQNPDIIIDQNHDYSKITNLYFENKDVKNL